MSLTVNEVREIVSKHALNDISACDNFRAVTNDEVSAPCVNHLDVEFMKKLDEGFHIHFGLENSKIYK